MRYTKETDPFYTSSAWLKVRARALERDCGLCVWCRDAGRTTTDRHGRRLPVLASMVHHVKPRKAYPELELTLDNLVSLCNRCHDEAHPEKHAERKMRDPVPEAARGIRVERL